MLWALPVPEHRATLPFCCSGNRNIHQCALHSPVTKNTEQSSGQKGKQEPETLAVAQAEASSINKHIGCTCTVLGSIFCRRACSFLCKRPAVTLEFSAHSPFLLPSLLLPSHQSFEGKMGIVYCFPDC